MVRAATPPHPILFQAVKIFNYPLDFKDIFHFQIFNWYFLVKFTSPTEVLMILSLTCLPSPTPSQLRAPFQHIFIFWLCPFPHQLPYPYAALRICMSREIVALITKFQFYDWIIVWWCKKHWNINELNCRYADLKIFHIVSCQSFICHIGLL